MSCAMAGPINPPWRREVGAMQRWPQFTSVSLAVSVAKQFAEPTSEQAPVVFKIKSLSGAPSQAVRTAASQEGL